LKKVAFALGALALILRVVLACTVSDVDYSGKTCAGSCPTGLTCIDGTCQTLDSLVYVTDFHVAWATPNSIRWAWTLQGKGTNLVSYQLALTSPTHGAAGAKVWTSQDNLELGGYQLRQSSGFDIVTGTITWELDPSTEYDGVLQLTDVDGHTFETASVRAVTDAPRERHLVAFDGHLVPGNYLTPSNLALIGDGGVEGGPSLYAPVAGETYANLRVDGLDLEPDTTLTPKLFDFAYLEFWIRGIGTPSSAWSEAWLRVYQTDGAVCDDFVACIYHFPVEWVYHPDPTAPGMYRRVQIPLSQFRRDNGAGEPLEAATLTMSTLVAQKVFEVNVGCPYGPDAKATYLDQIAIFW
jgi:hypothetical protein